MSSLTLSQTTNCRSFESQRVGRKSDDNFYENGRKVSKPVENTIGKGEIACYEQFLPFSQRFQKICAADT